MEKYTQIAFICIRAFLSICVCALLPLQVSAYDNCKDTNAIVDFAAGIAWEPELGTPYSGAIRCEKKRRSILLSFKNGVLDGPVTENFKGYKFDSIVKRTYKEGVLLSRCITTIAKKRVIGEDGVERREVAEKTKCEDYKKD